MDESTQTIRAPDIECVYHGRIYRVLFEAGKAIRVQGRTGAMSWHTTWQAGQPQSTVARAVISDAKEILEIQASESATPAEGGGS